MLATASAFAVVLGLAAASPDVGTAREILEKERCQTELPRSERMKGSSSTTRPTASPGDSSGPRAEAAPPGRVIRIPVISGPFMAIAMAIVIAVALALLLRNLPTRRPGLSPAETTAEKTEQKKPVRKVTLDDADRLAREGRFGEAIHALLLRALAELGRNASTPALTSREVLRGSKLAQEARAALGVLVSAVEWAHFGARPAGAADYAACAAEYRRFQDAWRTGA